MSKTLLSMKKKNSEAFVAPKSCQDAIPIKRVYDDGIFQVGRELFSKTFKFTDINYAVADYDDKQNMLQEYADFLSTLDAGVPTKITINNRRINRLDIERTLLLPDKDEFYGLCQWCLRYTPPGFKGSTVIAQCDYLKQTIQSAFANYGGNYGGITYIEFLQSDTRTAAIAFERVYERCGDYANEDNRRARKAESVCSICC